MRESDYQELRAELKKAKPVEIFPTGFEWLDEQLGGGLHEGSLLLVQAPSGVGKTSFLLSLARNWIQRKEKVLYISAGEQTKMEILRRFTAMDLGIWYWQLINDKDCDKRVLEWLEKAWPYIDVVYTEDAMEMLPGDGKTVKDRTRLEATVRAYNVDGVKRFCYDYIGSTPCPSEDSEWSMLARVAGKLKNLADELGAVIATAMQTNRAIYKEIRDFKPEKTAYLNEDFISKSVGVAQKATCCLTIIRADNRYYTDMYKNRQTGALGRLELRIDDKVFSYERAIGMDGFGQRWRKL